MPRYLIDGQGKTWDPFDEQLLVMLGDPDPDYDVISYAVRNLGFVNIVVGGPDTPTTVQMRELAVTPLALCAAAEFVLRVAIGPVTIICGNERWTERHFETPARAVEWLREHSTAEVLTAGFSDIAVLPQDLGRLSNRRLSSLEQSDDRLALLFKKWRIASGRFSYDVTQFLVNFGLLDRTALARPSDPGTIVWDHIGSKLNVYERDDQVWHLNFVGRPVDEQIDPNYGAFIQTAFRQTIAQREPRLDHIDAVIRNRHGAHRTRYDRLILPWQGENGEKIVSTLSYKTDKDLDVAA